MHSIVLWNVKRKCFQHNYSAFLFCLSVSARANFLQLNIILNFQTAFAPLSGLTDGMDRGPWLLLGVKPPIRSASVSETAGAVQWHDHWSRCHSAHGPVITTASWNGRLWPSLATYTVFCNIPPPARPPAAVRTMPDRNDLARAWCHLCAFLS